MDDPCKNVCRFYSNCCSASPSTSREYWELLPTEDHDPGTGQSALTDRADSAGGCSQEGREGSAPLSLEEHTQVPLTVYPGFAASLYRPLAQSCFPSSYAQSGKGVKVTSILNKTSGGKMPLFNSSLLSAFFFTKFSLLVLEG